MIPATSSKIGFGKVGHKEAQGLRGSDSTLGRAHRRNGHSFAAPEPLRLFVANLRIGIPGAPMTGPRHCR